MGKPKQPKEYGVFAWRADGRYPADLAVAEYVHVFAANRRARKLNDDPNGEHPEGGYVVRRLPLSREHRRKDQLR